MMHNPPHRGTGLTRRQLLRGAVGGAVGLVAWRWPWRVAHAAAQPIGQMTIGVHVTLSPTWFDPAETPGIITPFMFLYAAHDALLKPMPGNAFTPSRAESWSESPDGLTYGSYPNIDALFKKQARERDRTQRETLLHDIQRLMHAKVMYAPLFEPAFLCASGPRVAVSGLGQVPQFAYAGPYEDIQLKT